MAAGGSPGGDWQGLSVSLAARYRPFLNLAAHQFSLTSKCSNALPLLCTAKSALRFHNC